MKINIVLPFFIDQPGGGIKVMYQYANQLASKGHDVNIYHSMNTKWVHKKSLSIKYWKQFFFQKYAGRVVIKRPSWFQLNPLVKSFHIAKVSNSFIRDADIVLSTWWSTTIEVFSLQKAKGIKFNLIQDYEIYMTRQQDLVHASYELPLNHIVVSRYLSNIVAKFSKVFPSLIPNAIDHKQFYLVNPIENRDTHHVIMLYSESERKGSSYGIEALKKIIEKIPSLKVTLFGVYPDAPKGLSDNFNYYYLPDNLPDLYNQSSIFISPSIHEGWGLPAMEAMACGCACVCTNIEGHLDFMTDYQNVLFTEPANSSNIAEKVIELIKNNPLRMKLANLAVKHIENFTWDASCLKLEKIFAQTQKLQRNAD